MSNRLLEVPPVDFSTFLSSSSSGALDLYNEPNVAWKIHIQNEAEIK